MPYPPNDMPDPQVPTIGIFLYPSFDSLDVFGPYQVFTIMQSNRYLIGPSAKDLEHLALPSRCPGRSDCLYTTSFEGVRVLPDLTYEQYLTSSLKLDLVFVPGALSPELALQWGPPEVNPLFKSLKKAAGDARWVTSVCTGGLLLAAAGLLDGYRATTHWAYKRILELYGPAVQVCPGYPRFVADPPDNPRVVTGGGISSGLDEALQIASMLTSEDNAKLVQLVIQYNPHPPFDCGDPGVAEPGVLKQAQDRLDVIVERSMSAFSKYRAHAMQLPEPE